VTISDPTVAEPSADQPPHSPDAEVAVLGAMLIERSAANEVRDLLRPHHFYLPAHRTVFDAACAAIDRTGELDLITLADQLRTTGDLERIGGIEALAGINETVATAANVRAHAHIVREHALQRELIDISARAASEGQSSANVRADIERYQSQLADLAAFDRETDQIRRAGDVAGETLAWLEEIQNAEGGLLGIGSGIDMFDRLTYGFQKQRFYIMAARPAIGKSLVAIDFARHIAGTDDQVVAFFSLEMSANEILMRVLAAQAQVDNERMSRGTLEDVDWQKLSTAVADVASMRLYIDDDPGLTLGACERRCERIKALTGRLDAVFVDYLQLMEGSSGESRQQDVSGISRGMKKLSKSLDCPVIALSQLSRAVEERQNKRPMLSDLRESGALEQDADVVISLYRDSLYHEDSPDQGLIELGVLKNRAGRTGIASAAFMPHIYRIRNLATDREPAPAPEPTPF
jgi:replicative DNA helicase